LRALALVLLVPLLWGQQLKPYVDYLVATGQYPGVALLAQAVIGERPNVVLVERAYENPKEPLAAAVALKLLGYRVPPRLLSVEASSPCALAEKAFAYKVVGIPGWEALAKRVLNESPFSAISKGLACACKAALFLALTGNDPPWGGLLLSLRPEDVKSVEALIWCSAYQKLHGRDGLFAELSRYLSPRGFVKNELGSADPYLTAQFVYAFSVLKFAAPRVIPVAGTAYSVTTITVTTTLTETQKITEYATKTVTATSTVTVTKEVTSLVTTERAFGCLPADSVVTRTALVTEVTTVTLDPRGAYAALTLPAEGAVELWCRGCGTLVVGEGYSLYPAVRGGQTLYYPDGGTWTTAQCGGNVLWTAAGGLTINVIGDCTNTLTITLTKARTLVCGLG